MSPEEEAFKFVICGVGVWRLHRRPPYGVSGTGLTFRTSTAPMRIRSRRGRVNVVCKSLTIVDDECELCIKTAPELYDTLPHDSSPSSGRHSRHNLILSKVHKGTHRHGSFCFPPHPPFIFESPHNIPVRITHAIMSTTSLHLSVIVRRKSNSYHRLRPSESHSE